MDGALLVVIPFKMQGMIPFKIQGVGYPNKLREIAYLWIVTCKDADCEMDQWSKRIDYNKYTKHYNKNFEMDIRSIIIKTLCSILRWLYRYNRKNMHGEKLKQLCILACKLPNDAKNRTHIVDHISAEMYRDHGDGIIKYKQCIKRRERAGIQHGTVIDSMSKATKNMFRTHLYLL
eukprot:416175_1